MEVNFNNGVTFVKENPIVAIATFATVAGVSYYIGEKHGKKNERKAQKAKAKKAEDKAANAKAEKKEEKSEKK